MKNFRLLAIVASLTLVFSSCTSNESVLPEEQSLELLKSYKIKRDINGAYSIDFDFNENTSVDNVIDYSTSTNNFYLYATDNPTKRKVTQDLVIDGEQLRVGFVDENSQKSPRQITIKDDNIFLAKNTEGTKLNDWSITSNEDGTYTLDFKVKSKVSVDFVYNEEIKTYEIHLEDGKSSERDFSRVLEKEEGQPLKFDFVNHVKINNLAKGDVDLLGATISLVRKPQGVIL